MRVWLVGGALIERPGELLLVANRRANGAVDWTPPGGVIDVTDHTLLHGLTREVREETGLVVRGWDGPCYEVTVEAPGLGWRMRAEAWRATKVSGSIAPEDPDGIVEVARYVTAQECLGLLSDVARWVSEPVCSWLAEPWQDRRVFRYVVHGDSRATALVERVPE